MSLNSPQRKIKIVQAIVLAAGEGTRMRPLTYTKPKVMLPVANKPILHHTIENLVKAGIDEVVLVVGYKEETIREYFGEKFNGVRIRYVRQAKQLGTAHALLSAEHLLDDRFLMLNGDTIVFADEIKKLLDCELAIAVKRVDNPEDYGVVEVEGGFVKKIIEKPDVPPTDLINAGIYVFTDEILKFVKETKVSVRGEYEITDSITAAVKSGLMFRAVEIENWIDVGYPWDLLEANKILLSRVERRIEGEVEEGAVIKGNVVIEEGSVVMSGAYIVGPTVIGKNCRIGPNCYIRPYTAIGDNCHVGNAVEIKNSIIMRNSNAPHHNYVGDSIIGENCNLGAGTKIANLRLDEKEISVAVKGRIVKTGRKKFGAVIGDNVKTGINVSINVGAMIGNNVFIAPGAVVDGYVEPNSVIF